MNPQMNLLYLSETGHVLAVFTRGAEPAQPEKKPVPFVGDGLHVRGLGAPPASLGDYNSRDFIIPLEQLALLQTDLDAAVLLAPRASYVDKDKKLQSPTATTFTVNPSPSANPPQITISVPFGVLPLKYFMLIEGQALAAPLPFSGTIPAINPNVIVPIPSLADGDYYALVFVETYLPQVTTFSRP